MATDLLHSSFLSSLAASSIFNVTALPHSIMYSIPSLLLTGAFALQAVFASPSHIVRDTEILKRSTDTFIATESPIALRNLLCNIGANGACAAGASSGFVVASPSKTNPDCQSRRTCFVTSSTDLRRLLRLDP
jgi:glucoamylase